MEDRPARHPGRTDDGDAQKAGRRPEDVVEETEAEVAGEREGGGRHPASERTSVNCQSGGSGTAWRSEVRDGA